MKCPRLRPMLWTDNLEKTIRFYTETLGFTCGERNDDWQWASLYRDEIDIMVAHPQGNESFKPAFTGSLYINTDDVNGMWNQLKDKTEVVYEIENFEWNMREFAVRDNNGYMLQFGQEISRD